MKEIKEFKVLLEGNPSAEEPVLALGPLIGQMMYGRSIALRTVSKEDYALLKTGAKITFTDDAICIE